MLIQQRSIARLIAVLGVVACIAACSTPTTVSLAHTPLPSATATSGAGGSPTSSPTSTSAPPTSCASLIGSSTPATAGASFTDVPFPSGSVSTSITLHHSGTGLWSVYLFNACAPNTSASAVKSLFASQLPAHGWAQAPTLPFDGGLQQPCGDPYCWSKDGAPRYVGLEVVTDAGGGFVTYTIRLFTPPANPNCPSGSAGPFAGPNGPFIATLDGQVDLPAPPLTESGPGDGSSNGTTYNESSNAMCSAGTATSLQAFFQTELPKLGWHLGTPAGACTIIGTTSVFLKDKRAFTIGSPANGSTNVGWQQLYCTTLP